MPTMVHHRPHSARVEFDGKRNRACAVGLVENLHAVIEAYPYAVEAAREQPAGSVLVLPPAGAVARVRANRGADR